MTPSPLTNASTLRPLRASPRSPAPYLRLREQQAAPDPHPRRRVGRSGSGDVHTLPSAGRFERLPRSAGAPSPRQDIWSVSSSGLSFSTLLELQSAVGQSQSAAG